MFKLKETKFKVAPTCSAEILPVATLSSSTMSVAPTTAQTTNQQVFSTTTMNDNSVVYLYDSSRPTKWNGDPIKRWDQLTLIITYENKDHMMKLLVLNLNKFLVEYLNQSLDDYSGHKVCNRKDVSWKVEQGEIYARTGDNKFFIFADEGEKRLSINDFKEKECLIHVEKMIILRTTFSETPIMFAIIRKDKNINHRTAPITQPEYNNLDNTYIYNNFQLQQKENVHYIIKKGQKNYIFVFNFAENKLIDYQTNCMASSDKKKLSLDVPINIVYEHWNKIKISDEYKIIYEKSSTTVEFMKEDC
ncbi:hypothetical protein SNEBB_001385 [Seison nebaliae]|nr:hypothetical protein SNEBB_001385 [Seison nebaliae]